MSSEERDGARGAAYRSGTSLRWGVLFFVGVAAGGRGEGAASAALQAEATAHGDVVLVPLGAGAVDGPRAGLRKVAALWRAATREGAGGYAAGASLVLRVRRCLGLALYRPPSLSLLRMMKQPASHVVIRSPASSHHLDHCAVRCAVCSCGR